MDLSNLTTFLSSLPSQSVFFSIIASVSNGRRLEFETLLTSKASISISISITEFNGTIRGKFDTYYPVLYNYPAFDATLGIDIGAESNRLTTIIASKARNDTILSSPVILKRTGGYGIILISYFLNNYKRFDTSLFVTLDFTTLFPVNNMYIEISDKNTLVYSNKNETINGAINNYNFTIFGNIWNIKLESKQSPEYALAYVSSVVYLTIFVIIMFIVIKRLSHYQEKIRLKIKNEKAILQMVQYVNHEIRNPLSVIKGLLELSIEDIQDLHTGLQYKNETDCILSNLATANSSCDLLKHIVNDILDISKLQENKLVIEKTDINVDQLILELTKILNSKCQEKPSISVEYSNNIDNIFTDKFRLVQIMINIITNAIKFTDSGYIKINLSLVKDSNMPNIDHHKSETSVIITVEDTGRGIRPEQYVNIFAPFEQTESADYIRYGGVGLGMYLCKLLVHRLGGDIGFISELSKGTTFYVILDDGFHQ